jgi:hypothetical protein
MGAVLGFVGGLTAELVAGLFEGTFRPLRIGVEGLIVGLSLALAAAAACGPSGWLGRGLAGGVTFGAMRGGLTVVFSLAEVPWPEALGGEVIGGVVGGLLIAYLWRPNWDEEGDVLSLLP